MRGKGRRKGRKGRKGSGHNFRPKSVVSFLSFVTALVSRCRRRRVQSCSPPTGCGHGDAICLRSRVGSGSVHLWLVIKSADRIFSGSVIVIAIEAILFKFCRHIISEKSIWEMLIYGGETDKKNAIIFDPTKQSI